LQIAGAADVPRVGNNEAAALVQLAKGLALIADGGHGRVLRGWEEREPATFRGGGTMPFRDGGHQLGSCRSLWPLAIDRGPGQSASAKTLESMPWILLISMRWRRPLGPRCRRPPSPFVPPAPTMKSVCRRISRPGARCGCG